MNRSLGGVHSFDDDGDDDDVVDDKDDGDDNDALSNEWIRRTSMHFAWVMP